MPLDASEKLEEKFCISCGKDTKRHQKSFPKPCKDIFTIAYPT